MLLDGLKGLEYRGYDSAGVAIVSKNGVSLEKRVGPVKVLSEALAGEVGVAGNLGIGHTRWATHGEPNKVNTHPHADCKERLLVAHNGIIENHKELRDHLKELGHRFVSDTDTEVIPHLIEDFLERGQEFKVALLNTLKLIRGAYALAIVDANKPDRLYAVRLSSPLVLGVGEGEYFLASDPSALIGKTRGVIYLKDGEIAEITKTGINITDSSGQKTVSETVRLEWDIEQARKGNYPHFMLKEIFEGPETIRAATRGRLKIDEGFIKLGGLEPVAEKLKKAKRLLILSCGTSYYAGLVGEYLFEEIAKIPTEVQLASEFRYREEPFAEGTVAITISQSGETADTLAAMRKAKDNRLLTLGIVNTVGSTIARESDAGVYNHAGPEIGVASTKAFISQLTVLTLMAMYFSKNKGQLTDRVLLKELERIPEKIEVILEQADQIKKLAEQYKDYENFLFLGRRYNYPVALEGALKLKEISYIHAEGYGAGEMKHGPIALIDKHFPTLAITPKNRVTDKMYTSLEEIKARKGPLLAIATEGDSGITKITDDVFFIPETIEPLEPFLTVVPLQLFAYYVGVARGHDVDKPRNLAKSVTVE